MITVAQLIGALMKYPGGLRVVIPGYEAGFNDAAEPREIQLELDANDPEDWFFGPHEEAAGGSPAILIARAKREASAATK